MEVDAASSHPEQGTSKVPRACDTCRARKVRCDKTTPCSNCRALKVTCQVSTKVAEQRQRILVSSRYESKVESIDERLSGIEKSLQALQASASISTFRSPRSDTPWKTTGTPMQITSVPCPASRTSPKKLGGSKAFEGDSSFTATSLHAKTLFEGTLSKNAFTRLSPEMKDALSDLQSTLKAQSDPSSFHDLRFPNIHSSSTVKEGSSTEMPPMSEALDLLRSFKGGSPKFFLDLPVLSFSHFTQLCQNVYFCTDEYSPAVFALVNGGLLYLFMECIPMRTADRAEEYRHYALLCQSNLENTLAKFDLLLAPSLENCQALIFGAIHATNISRPSLCLRLVSAAVQMCQSLGYHRISGPKDISLEFQQKVNIFWTAYTMDKAMSLRLGRMSSIQDCDIATRLPDYPSDPLSKPWHRLYLGWIEFAGLQGRVYELLYTVSALSASPQEREARAQRLVVDLKKWYQNNGKFVDEDVYLPESFKSTIETNEVVFSAVMTIVLRSIPPSPSDSSSTFNDECIASAYQFFTCHQNIKGKFKDTEGVWHMYLMWTVMYNPLSPFMVIFCQAVRSLNKADLRCLEDFITSLQPVDPASEAVGRLHSLCSAFYRVARVYFDESFCTQGPIGVQTGNEMPDLGLWPNSGLFQDPFGLEANETWPMDELFTGDPYMMGLLDGSFVPRVLSD